MNKLGPLILELYSISRLEIQQIIPSSRDSAIEPFDLPLFAPGVVGWRAVVRRLSRLSLSLNTRANTLPLRRALNTPPFKPINLNSRYNTITPLLGGVCG